VEEGGWKVEGGSRSWPAKWRIERAGLDSSWTSPDALLAMTQSSGGVRPSWWSVLLEVMFVFDKSVKVKVKVKEMEVRFAKKSVERKGTPRFSTRGHSTLSSTAARCAALEHGAASEESFAVPTVNLAPFELSWCRRKGARAR
jgi:hypothetical protein